MLKLLAAFAPEKAAEAFASAQATLSGKKTYLAAGIMLLQACATLSDQLCAVKGLGGFADWLAAAASNDALLRCTQALALMGLRAGIGKMQPSAPAN